MNSSGKIIPIIFPLHLNVLIIGIRTPLHLIIIMSCILLHLIARYLFLPLRHSFPVDPEVPTDQEPYPSEDQFASAELPGKQPPLIIPISPIPFSLILALVAVVTFIGRSYSDA